MSAQHCILSIFNKSCESSHLLSFEGSVGHVNRQVGGSKNNEQQKKVGAAEPFGMNPSTIKSSVPKEQPQISSLPFMQRLGIYSFKNGKQEL